MGVSQGDAGVGSAIDRPRRYATMPVRRADIAMHEQVTSVPGNAGDCVASACIGLAQELAPLITAHAGATEQAREIAPQVIGALH